MRPELEKIKILENFIKGNLPEAQAVDVQIRLLWDQSWQQALARQRLAYRALQAAGRQQLRLELKTIHNQLFT